MSTTTKRWWRVAMVAVMAGGAIGLARYAAAEPIKPPLAFKDEPAVWARSAAPLTDRGWKRLQHLPDRWPIPVLPVSGHDLIASGMKASPGLGDTLRQLEDWWLAGDFKPDRQTLLQRLSSGRS